MHQIGKQNISLASLIATNNFQPVAKITQYRPLTPSVPPFPVTQATIGHSKATHAPIHYPETIYKSPKLPSTPYLINFKLVYYNPGWMGVWVGMGMGVGDGCLSSQLNLPTGTDFSIHTFQIQEVKHFKAAF